VLHHIRHNEYGDTLYGGFYETLPNFACLNGKAENNKADGEKRQKWEHTFIKMWKLFKAGKFREAVSHWSKPYRDAFLRQRKSKTFAHLDYWFRKINIV